MRPEEKPSEKISQLGLTLSRSTRPLEEGRDLVDVHAGGLDPQQVLERQRVAPLLEREHDFAGVEHHDMVGEIVDRIAGDRLGDHPIGLAHRDIADHDEARAGGLGEILEALRPRAGAEHDDAALERLAAQRLAEQDAQSDQRGDRAAHRVEQVRAPEADLGDQEIEHAQADHAQRDRHDQPRHRIAQRLERIGTIDADCDHRDLEEQRVADELRPALLHQRQADAELMGAQHPAELARHRQQQDVEKAEQQHRVGHVMLEQPDHGEPL